MRDSGMWLVAVIALACVCPPVTEAEIQSLPFLSAGQGAVPRQDTSVVVLPVDVQPQHCPNVLSLRNGGQLAVAVLGLEASHVDQIDMGTVRLMDVSPIRAYYEDVATPVGDGSECTTAGEDGYLDLVFRFSIRDIAAVLGEVENGDVIPLQVTGVFLSGRPFHGSDNVVISSKPVKPK